MKWKRLKIKCKAGEKIQTTLKRAEKSLNGSTDNEFIHLNSQAIKFR